ncbi:MAG: thioredoxin domain-containing protein [Spirochaetia bacterium]|nr:thioredoxin domain-containing protein [Spirochaetia bacterium]
MAFYGSIMKENKRILLYIAMAVSLIGVILTALLVCKHNFPDLCKLGGFGCSVSGVDGCSKLGESDDSKLFGFFSISGIGFFYYSFMMLLFFKFIREDGGNEKKIFSLIAVLTATGLVSDLYFSYVNFAVLDVPCMLCAYTYGVTAVLAVIVFLLYKNFYSGMNAKELANFLPGFSSSILEFLIAFFLMIALFVVFTLSSVPGSVKDSEGVKLLPADEVNAIISHLNSLPEANLGNAGLTSMEGVKEGYIVIHKFADFRCPHCLHAGEILQEALKRWPGRVKIFYRHFPLDGTCNPLLKDKQKGAYSCNGAQAAICASHEPYFSDYYHGLFQFQYMQKNLSLQNLKILTESLNGNWNQIVSCMGSPRTAAILNRDIQDAKMLKMSSTPTIIVNNRMLKAGTPNPEYLFQILDALVFQKEGDSAYQEFQARQQ